MENTLKVTEVAHVMRVDKQTVYRMIWAGELPWINIGGGKQRPRIRVHQAAVERFLKSRERAA